jgi:hypothetical protein
MLLIVGGSLMGCSSTPASRVAGERHPTTSGELSVKVTSVTAALEPYDPQIANAGIPAEQVNFTVRTGAPRFSCMVEVRRSSHTVGKTTVEAAAFHNDRAAVAESVAVEGIKGGTFPGHRSNALVACRTP